VRGYCFAAEITVIADFSGCAIQTLLSRVE
jgi:hypothetical protein